MSATRYEITFRGEAGPRMLAMFEEFEISVGDSVTVLHAELNDQAALLGVIDRIASLGLELTAVRPVARGDE